MTNEPNDGDLRAKLADRVGDAINDAAEALAMSSYNAEWEVNAEIQERAYIIATGALLKGAPSDQEWQTVAEMIRERYEEVKDGRGST